MPELYAEDYHVKLDEAKRWLEEDGFRAEAVVVKPNIIYKDCENYEVVGTNYSLKDKVAPGTRIILRYVTTEVIEASRRLFEEAEQAQAEAEQTKLEEQAAKTAKRAEQAETVKQRIGDTASTAQRGIGIAATTVQSGAKSVFGKFTKSKGTEADTDSE